MVFLLIQKNLAKIGISKQQSQQAHPFNGKILIGTVVLGINAILQFIFLAHDAHGFRELTESIYMTSIGIAIFICYVSFAFKIDEIYGFIDVADGTVEETKSMYHHIRFYFKSKFQNLKTIILHRIGLPHSRWHQRKYRPS